MVHLHLIKQQKILNIAHFLYTVLFEARSLIFRIPAP